MNAQCNDLFGNYSLPFKTYSSEVASHDYVEHSELELIWLIEGSAVITCENRDYDLQSQSLFMVFMNRRHCVKTTPGSVLISYHFNKEHLEHNNLLFETIPFTDRVYTFKELTQKYHVMPLLITEIMKLLVEPASSPVTRYKIIGYYNLFIVELYNMLLKEKYLDIKTRNNDPYLIRIHTLIEYIHQHAHTKITLDDLSKLAGISSYRLSHFIKDYLGISFSEFLQNTRLESALWYLTYTNMSVCDVAKKSGFSDVKYLNQMLKNRYGLTASKYRREANAQKIKESLSHSEKDFLDNLRICLKEIENETYFSDTYYLIKNYKESPSILI